MRRAVRRHVGQKRTVISVSVPRHLSVSPCLFLIRIVLMAYDPASTPRSGTGTGAGCEAVPLGEAAV
jgi:hypothetical protein